MRGDREKREIENDDGEKKREIINVSSASR